MKRAIGHILSFIFVLMIVTSSMELFTSSDTIHITNVYPNKSHKFNSLILQNIPQKDTIYVLGNSFIEIILDSQAAILHLRDGSITEYDISSGTDRISKGIKTRVGLFSVQNKTPLATSSQFNNAELINWIGYNYNIGFHGLRSSSYYRYLGKRPSSHGCVRISREDGKELYNHVRVGTPVIVYEEEPARVLAFAEPNDFTPNHDFMLKNRGYDQLNMLNERLKNIYSGKSYLNTYTKVFIDGKTSLRPGAYDIGKTSLIPDRQVLINPYKQIDHSVNDNLTHIKQMKLLDLD